MRSRTTSTLRRSTISSGGSQSSSKAEIRSARPPPSTSRNPSVVISAVLTPLRSRIALVETVAPWRNDRVSSPRSPARAKPLITPSKKVGGVEGTLPIRCSPVSRLTPMTSVKVPPISVPTTQTRFPLIFDVSARPWF